MSKFIRNLTAYRFSNLVLAAAVLVAFYFAEIALIREEQLRLVVTDITYPVLNGLAVLALGAAAAHSARRSRRLGLAWGSFALAQLFFMLGDVAWAVLEIGYGKAPYPSIADAFYLAYYPLIMLGILLLPGRHFSRAETSRRVMDLAIIAIASTLMSWIFLIGPLLYSTQAQEGWVVQLLSAAYPAGDLIMVWGLLLLAYKQFEGQAWEPLLLMAAGGLVMIVTDSVFIRQALQGVYASGGLLDSGWVTVNLLAALAGLAQARAMRGGSASIRKVPLPGWVQRYSYCFPYLWAAGAVILGISSHYVTLPIDFFWLASGVGFIMGLVILRQIVTLQENQRLLAQLNQALDHEQWQAQELEKSNQELLQEITERKRIERQMAYDALHDPLTGLPNRALCLDRLAHSIEFSRRRANYTFAVLFLDIDDFKVINDSLGHTFGDQLLARVAERLKQSVRASDTVARLGGDEFVVLLEDIRSEEIAIETVERIQKSLGQPFQLLGHEVVAASSIGVVTHTGGYASPEEILRDADIAMYRAKMLGKSQYAIFSPDLHSRAVARLQLENELRHAVERQEFQLLYQPIYDLNTGQVVGFEALVRWLHPRRGLLLPADFIGVAEETGLIVPLGRWVLRQACRQMSRWQEQFEQARNLVINVNISSKQFALDDFAEQIETILGEARLKARSLRLEITESVVIDHHALADDVFLRLERLGVQTQIDDFGTGYSSLSYLQHIPIQGIKIDRSFIQQIDRASKNADLVRTILRMAGDLGVNAVAEGIETEAQLAALKALACPYGQGFQLSRPLDRGQVEKILSKMKVEVEVYKN